MSIAISMAGGNLESTRMENDFYPTEPAATHALMRFLKYQWRTGSPLRIWEPACGCGDMSKVFLEYKTFVDSVISTDLYDYGYGFPGVDFLKTDHLPETPTGVYKTIITNPPFDLMPDFFQHASDLGAERIVFLLKAQYWHSNWQKPPCYNRSIWEKWEPSWWLPNTWRLQFRSADANSKKSSSTMDTAWCVWDRHAAHTGCLMVPLKKPIGY